MNANYINRKLVIWAELLYGKDSECYSKRITEGKKKKKKEYFIFGSKKGKFENKVTKQVALFIAAGQLPKGVEKKVRYQIMFMNLETGTTMPYANGAVYSPDEAEAEMKILKKEQKELKKLKLPRTKSDIKLKKVNIHYPL